MKYIMESNESEDARSRHISQLSLHLAFCPFKAPRQSLVKLGGRYHERNWGVEEQHNLRDAPIFLRDQTSAGTSMVGL